MYSDAISSELRKVGVDAISIHDRSELEGSSDEVVMRVAIAEHRVLVTNNVRDYAPLVEDFGLRGQTHFGVVFTDDLSFPRTRAGIGLLVRSLVALAAGVEDDALMNGCQYLERG
jgi:hypothetical protein